MEQRERIYGVILIVLAAFWSFLILPVYGASKPEKGYYVCVGSFKNMVNAKHEVIRLIQYKASMNEGLIAGETIYRVYIGPYKSKDQARNKARQLQKNKVIASYHIQKMVQLSSGFQAISMSKTSQQKEQTVQEAETPPAKLKEIITPPPVADQTMSSQKTESLAKDDGAASQRSSEKAGGDVTIDQQSTAVKKIETETKPEKTVEESRPAQVSQAAKKEKDWFLTAGYSLWYMDMTKHYVNGNFAVKDLMHGPTIGFSKKNLGISFTYLTTMSDKGFNATRNEVFDSGEAYSRKERFKRDDYDASLRYTLYNINQVSASILAGLKYTRLYDMSSTYTREGGQYTITGNMDIWGPALGFELIAPLGYTPQSPFLFSVGASGMYLKASGNHPQFVDGGHMQTPILSGISRVNCNSSLVKDTRVLVSRIQALRDTLCVPLTDFLRFTQV
jgi:hypothetical protein